MIKKGVFIIGSVVEEICGSKTVITMRNDLSGHDYSEPHDNVDITIGVVGKSLIKVPKSTFPNFHFVSYPDELFTTDHLSLEKKLFLCWRWLER